MCPEEVRAKECATKERTVFTLGEGSAKRRAYPGPLFREQFEALACSALSWKRCRVEDQRMLSVLTHTEVHIMYACE